MLSLIFRPAAGSLFPAGAGAALSLLVFAAGLEGAGDGVCNSAGRAGGPPGCGWGSAPCPEPAGSRPAPSGTFLLPGGSTWAGEVSSTAWRGTAEQPGASGGAPGTRRGGRSSLPSAAWGRARAALPCAGESVRARGWVRCLFWLN